MKKYILAVVVALLSNQAYSQVADDTTTSHPTHHARKNASVVESPRLPPPSKASVGFFTALSNLNWDLMDLYLNQGADINCRNCNSTQDTPLLFSISSSSRGGWGTSIKVTKWLVEHGANVNQANSQGVTPIMLAAKWTQNAIIMGPQIAQGDDTVLSYLIEHGANALAEDKEGKDALFYLLPSASQINYQVSLDVAYQRVATALIEKGANINKQNKIGETILMVAASNCADASAKFLLSSGADTSKTNKLKQTALDIAIEKATNSVQNSYCNNTVKLLQSPQAISQRNSSSYSSASSGTSQNASGNVYAGSYSGSYTGDDYGPFQVTIGQDGRVNLTGKSLQNNQAFSGTGKVSNDGTLGVSLGSVSTGATFQGSINPKTGAMYGTWKNSGLAGNFSGNKQGQASNPLEALGSLLNGINKALAPQ